MRAIGIALRHRGLRLLLTAGLISLTGDWVLRVGLAYFVYALTGSTLASAVMLLASFVPQILLSSVAGVFVDRWHLKPTMVVTNLLLAVGLLPLLAVRHSSQIWIVYAVVAFEGCIAQFFAPAEQSVVPQIVDDEHLVTANALSGQNSGLSRLIGSAVGGVVAATGGITGLAVVDAASFLVAAALIARIPLPRRAARTPAESDEPATAGLAGVTREWREGIRAIRASAVLRFLAIFLLIASLGEGVMGTLFAPFVRSVLHGSVTDYGLIVAAQAIGGIGGGLVAASIGNRPAARRVLGWSAVAFGLIDLAIFLYPLIWVTVWPAIALMIVVGVPGSLLLAAAMTLLQRNTSDALRGRVFGSLGAVEGVAIVTGTVAAGLLGQSLGIVATLCAQGAGYVAAGAMILITLRGSVPAAAPDTIAHTETADPIAELSLGQ